MIHKACMPVYIVIQIFLAHGRTDIQPGVVQEVLADLKSLSFCASSPSSPTIHEEIFNLIVDGEVIRGSD